MATNVFENNQFSGNPASIARDFIDRARELGGNTNNIDTSALSSIDRRSQSRSGTRNAPLNDTARFEFNSIERPDTNPENAFNQGLRYNQLAGQQGRQNTVGGAQDLAGLTADQYQKKADIDYQQAVRASQIPRNTGNSAGLAMGNQNAFGKWGSPSQAYGNMGGFNLAADNDRRVRDFQMQRGEAATTARMISEGEAGGSILANKRAQEQSRINARQQNNLNADLMNRQFNLNTQQSAIDYDRQARERALDRGASQRLAETQAAGNVFGSMFGALSSPGANYRYWG